MTRESIDPRYFIDIRAELLRLLAEAPAPVKARDLVSLLEGHVTRALSKSLVNSILYKLAQQGLVESDPQYRWHLKEDLDLASVSRQLLHGFAVQVAEEVARLDTSVFEASDHETFLRAYSRNEGEQHIQQYDYSQVALYYLRFYTVRPDSALSTIENGKVKLTQDGRAAYEHWVSLVENSTKVRVDAFNFMPNHVQGIVAFDGFEDKARAAMLSLARSFLTSTNRTAMTRFLTKYYFSPVLNDQMLFEVRDYIWASPRRWEKAGEVRLYEWQFSKQIALPWL
jgi:putative transposase